MSDYLDKLLAVSTPIEIAAPIAEAQESADDIFAVEHNKMLAEAEEAQVAMDNDLAQMNDYLDYLRSLGFLV